MSDMTSQVILAGDIGGTKTRLALYRLSHSTLELLAEDVFQSRNYTGLEAILHDFQPKKVSVGAACFGIAGPVEGGVIRTTNLPWSVDTESLQKEFDAREIFLINDLVANACGIKVLRKSDFQVLNRGVEQSGNRAILSAGTGLGEAILFWNGARPVSL
jgi:glucokinase